MSLSITTTLSLSSQSVANNTSTVTWKVKYKKSSSTYNNNGAKYYVEVGGTRVKSGTWKPKKGTTSGTIASGTTTIKHNADGTHAQIRAYAKVYDTGFSPSSADDYSPYLSLPTIKRTFTVSYNANGGTGAPASQTKTYGVDLTLSSTVPTRAAYAFKGWAKSSTGAVAYPAGGTYKENAAVTLYAVWELLGNVKIESYSAFRCDLNGNAADEGTSGKFTCTYVLSGPGLNEGSVTARYRASDVSTWTNISNTDISHGNHSKPANTPSLSVNVSCLIKSNISQDKSYIVELTVTDSYGNTAIASDYISQAYFTMDFLAGGKGIGIGTTASCDESKHPNGLLTCGMDAVFSGNTEAKDIKVSTERISLGRYVAAAILTGSGGSIYFTVPLGRVLKDGATVKALSFQTTVRASNANGNGIYIIKNESGGTSSATFNYEADKTYSSSNPLMPFYDGANNRRTPTVKPTILIEGNTFIYFEWLTGTSHYFSGNSTNTKYLNNNACTAFLSNIIVDISYK